jgi:hypothetical protein
VAAGRHGGGGDILGEGVGESGGTHRTSPLMNGAFLERIQSPIHRSPRGPSLNKYGQGFNPIWKPSLPISQRKQAYKGGLRSFPPAGGTFGGEGCEMQMWVKKRCRQEVCQTCEEVGRRGVADSRFLTFLTSTRTAPFPTSHLWISRPEAGVWGCLRR